MVANSGTIEERQFIKKLEKQMKKIVFLTAIAMAFTFAACTDEGINNSINGNVVGSKSIPDIGGCFGELGFYLVGGDEIIYTNTRITLSITTTTPSGDVQVNEGHQRRIVDVQDGNRTVRCDGAGSGCTPTIVVNADELFINEIFADLDEAIEEDTIDEFFDERNKDRYELLFNLSECDLFNLRNRIITLGKYVKSENRFAYYVTYIDDPYKIYE